MSTEKTSREMELLDTFDGNIYKLNQALTALDSITDKYHWDYHPDPRKAIEYAGMVHPDESGDDNARHSWEYIIGYENIMFLVNVARDYCCAVIDECERVADPDECSMKSGES